MDPKDLIDTQAVNAREMIGATLVEVRDDGLVFDHEGSRYVMIGDSVYPPDVMWFIPLVRVIGRAQG